MNRRDPKSSPAVILSRMAATRAQLLASNHATSLASIPRHASRLPAAQGGPIFLQTPYAGLIAAALVVSVVLAVSKQSITATKFGMLRATGDIRSASRLCQDFSLA